MTDDGSVVSVSEYTSALKRYWWKIALAGLFGGLLGYVLMGLKSSLYLSEARVEVRPLIVEGDSPNLDVSRQVSMTTERSIAGSQRVAERANALIAAANSLNTTDLDDPAVEELASRTVTEDAKARSVAKNITVTVPSDSHILVITGENQNAERAREITEAVAYAYIDLRREGALASTSEVRDRLVAEEAKLANELAELAVKKGETDNATTLEQLENDTISLRSQRDNINARLLTLSVITVDPGDVIDDPAKADSASGIPPIAGPIFGGLLGLSAAVALAYLFDRRDDRFRSIGTELTRMGLNPIGNVPVGQGRFHAGSGSNIADFGSNTSESYRMVQGSLMFNLDRADKSIILVTGTNNPQSTTTVAANLAAAAARAGRRTLLIGADLRRPGLHARFDVENNKGLTDVVARAVNLPSVLLTPIESTDLQLLTAGTAVDQPARLLQGPDFGRFVASIREDYDLIVFEGPPVLNDADAVDIARLCEGVVLVVEPSRSGRGDVADSVQQLRRIGADVVATIVAENDPV